MLKERGVHLAGIVDEGGGITEGLAAGVRGAIGLIGVSEKGYLTVEIAVHGQPGHSSTPPPQTAIGILARALARLEAHPMPTHLRRLRPMYRGIGMAAPIWLQVAFANIWLCGPFLRRWLMANPEMNASMRTTTALTIIQGGVEDNTIPAEAQATVNFRLIPGETIADVLWHAKKVIGDERVHITPVEGKFNEALPISPNKCPAYDGLKTVVRQVFDNPPVAPFVMLGGTDCQHFVPVCDHIYRFTSVVMDESFRGLEHGIDERIPVDGDGEDGQVLRPTDAGLGHEGDDAASSKLEAQEDVHENRCRTRRECPAEARRADDSTMCSAPTSRSPREALAPVARQHQIVLAHGNGPQVGLLALQASAYKDVEAYPARRAGRADRGHDRLHDRAGAGQPAALRGAVRHDPDHGRGRSATTRRSRIRPSSSARCMTRPKPTG